uniref:Plakophilin 3 n=1 Tax=Varanus komodoensis TaxID=61221 RepID=A0A8D2IJ87_VARKO
MQESNFFLSALQPENGVCSLALPSDQQLDRKARETQDSELLKSARVQEQVRMRMLQRSFSGPKGNAGAMLDCAELKGGNPSNGHYSTLQPSFSSRSQTNGTDHTSTVSTKTESSTSWSSHSAVDLRSNNRVATISNGVGPTGLAYGANYAFSQAANSAPRPRSFHERTYRPRQNYDTMSLHSLRLADGPGSPRGADDHYSIVSEQLDPLAQAGVYRNRGSGFNRSYSLERQMSAGSNVFPKGPVDWMDGVEAPQSRTVIRAPAMRTLQRFQSNNRSRVGNTYAGMERSSHAPSVRSLVESNHRLQDLRAIDMYDGHNTLMSQQSFSGGFDDIDLPSAVKYLMAADPNLQVLGAAYIQHKCYSDSDAKRQARSLQAVPKLVKLFNNPNQEVQRHATGAMRNLIYDNADNKLALVEENGIYELLRTLREQDDELRKNVTGIFWNLSSSDNLKDRLARDTLEQLTDLVLTPLSGSGSAAVIQQNASEAEIFYNATGFLRNLSSASQQTRQKMRECHGLVDSMVNYINSSLEIGKSEDKSVENAVCVLRNLSYRLYDEMPPSALQRLEGQKRSDGATMTGELVGCFSPQSRRARELHMNSDIVTFTEVSKDPRGMEWLWNPQIIGVYNRLLQRCELNKHTTEAAAGALQNITAGDRRWAGVLSRVALEQERILNSVLDRVRTADHHQLRSLTGVIRNLSRNARNKDEIKRHACSTCAEESTHFVYKWPPADVVVNIIAVLNNLVVESSIAARDIVYFDGLRKLFYIKKKRDRCDCRGAVCLLGERWVVFLLWLGAI